MISPIYMVIPTNHIGGAEKRLLRIWLELTRTTQLPLQLITTKSLYAHALKIDELKGLHQCEHLINTSLLKGHTFDDLESLKIFAENLDETSTFHYLLLPPIKTCSRHRYIYTMPSSSLSRYNAKGLASFFLGCLMSHHIDVLSPSVLQYLQKIFFLKRHKFSLTPGSFVDFDHYSAKGFSERSNELVFVGLLSPDKQADRLFNCIPGLYKALEAKGHQDIKFSFLGRSTEQFNPEAQLQNDPNFKDIPIEVGFSTSPQSHLTQSKVFFSIQKADNYPSKSLLEAMACGNQIVVTDVGHSEKIAPRDTCFYVPKDFEESHLISACDQILSLSEEEYNKRTEANLNFIKQNFSISKSLKYFEKLYTEGNV